MGESETSTTPLDNDEQGVAWSDGEESQDIHRGMGKTHRVYMNAYPLGCAFYHKCQ
jgi:hypothetical protein